MRILYVNTPVYDFLTATLIEGLNALADEGQLELVVTERSNYARRSSAWSTARILKEADRFDAVILGSNRDLNLRVWKEAQRPDRAVALDGADETHFTRSPDDFVLYFKRELALRETHAPHVFPCPFAVEERWWWENEGPRPLFLSAVFDSRPGERAATLDFLSSRQMPDIHLGSVPAKLGDLLDGVRRGQCRLATLMVNRWGVGHNPRYAQVLRSSSLSLSVRGLGWDTARYWEILGSGAVLVSRPPEIEIPAPLVAGEHYLAYTTHEELLEVLAQAKAEPQRVEKIRRAAREHVRAHHTTRERARYVVEKIRERIRPT